MFFTIQKELFDRLPDLTIGVVVAMGLDNTRPCPEIDRFLSQTIEELKRGFPADKVQEHPRIKPWRSAFARIGLSGSKFQSSIEAMTRRILKGDPFPRINALVDLYNGISLKHLVPMGGHDLDTLTGNISLQFAEGWEPFSPMGGGETVSVSKGELVYRDEREVLTRNWVWRQCEKDKATEKTTNIFIPIDVLGEVGPGVANEIIRELTDRIPSLLGGSALSAVFNRDQRRMEIPSHSSTG